MLISVVSTSLETTFSMARLIAPYSSCTGEQQMDEWFGKYSVLEMIKNMPEEDLKSVKWFIDCGDDDFLYEGNSLVHIHMKKIFNFNCS